MPAVPCPLGRAGRGTQILAFAVCAAGCMCVWRKKSLGRAAVENKKERVLCLNTFLQGKTEFKSLKFNSYFGKSNSNEVFLCESLAKSPVVTECRGRLKSQLHRPSWCSSASSLLLLREKAALQQQWDQTVTGVHVMLCSKFLLQELSLPSRIFTGVWFLPVGII